MESSSKSKILLVDDQITVTDSITRCLKNQFSFLTASSGIEAVEKLKLDNGQIAVVVSDFRMPKMDGIEFLKIVEKSSPDTIRVVLTGSVSQSVAIKSLNECHAHFFLTKPVRMDHFADVLRVAIAKYSINLTERDLLQNTLSAAVNLMVEMLYSLDPMSFGQNLRAKNLIQSIVSHANIQNSWVYPLSAMLYRLGILKLPNEIRQKLSSEQELTAVEKKIADTYPGLGADLIAKIPRLEGVAEIIRYHNKSYDGRGYPINSKSGDNIPWGARLLRVVNDLIDLVDKGENISTALAKLKVLQGSYDPEMINLVAKHIKGVNLEVANVSILANSD